FRGDDLSSNLPWLCVIGMGSITSCDIISRTIIHPLESPGSVILATEAEVVFITIVLRHRKTRMLT
ncbi:iron chelate uptake ABC transporter family permease subunit, partial [Bacillus thuringiensis]|uniref:iron chelate uptake ABC transporter family permease subunit n=1 Tax=Bacillus thuringiensis TaxID=1428 RepID=UPI00284AEEC4